ncbi:hypothetical protein AVEN_241702-1 [Araneus ventricosus]|uniref:Uncharacterized protein n=1 Tax=Araneus ventricosus TaxID=182803 RepID=A0A4Y2NC36_ARAVE|nr:hypothetical protein AVEN_241702-1 [Araneus ventricosus]
MCEMARAGVRKLHATLKKLTHDNNYNFNKLNKVKIKEMIIELTCREQEHRASKREMTDGACAFIALRSPLRMSKVDSACRTKSLPQGCCIKILSLGKKVCRLETHFH